MAARKLLAHSGIDLPKTVESEWLNYNVCQPRGSGIFLFSCPKPADIFTYTYISRL